MSRSRLPASEGVFGWSIGSAGQWVLMWLALTIVVLPVDSAISERFSRDAARWVGEVLGFPSYMGRYSIHLLILAVLMSFPNWRRLALGYGLPMVCSALAATALKYLVGRARPEAHAGFFHFDPFSPPGSHMNSFPSGDAVAAMALATLLGIYFPRSRRLFWLLGACAALARVARGEHFLSDVIFGAGLGILIVLATARWLGPAYYEFDAPPVAAAPED